jgi:hypothetical protein
MKISKKRILGAGVFLISILMICSSGATIANNVDKEPIEQTAAIDTANMEYPVNVNYQKEEYDIGGFQRAKCYACNLHSSPDNLNWFYSDIPDDFIHIADISSVNFLSGGCFVGEFGDDTWWASEYSDVEDSNVWKIDEETGAMELVGNAGVGLHGLAYDPTTETLYGCGTSELYIINQETADATTIGSFGISSGLMIGIACDMDGKIYGEDLGTDSLYEIDSSTGVATLIGPLGININYAQDIAYDKDKDVLYSTGYKGSANGGGALGTLDLNDGHYTLIGDFPEGENGVPSEVDCFAIPYGMPNEPPEAPEIDGPPSGNNGEELCWTFHSDDPNGDELKYIIDWGDGNTEETDCNPSCTPVEVCHIYEDRGKYIIKARAQECPDGETSAESTYEITIPRARSTYNPLLLRIFERYPNTFFILRALLGI